MVPPKVLGAGLALTLLGVAACGEDPQLGLDDKEVCLTRRDGVRYCIELFEASRADANSQSAGVDDTTAPRSLSGRMPWTGLTWAAARAACELKGKRLCDFDEWIDACDGEVGDGGLTYTYGDTRDESNATCNTGSGAAEPTGSREACESPTTTMDQSGNVWEWSGNTMGAASARGGGFRSTQTHQCASTLMDISPTTESPEVGFRCCRDT
ncbi:MAG: SUMF1/EgtB/PvdO family nonheme iron enzyme [Deltaproteobacteria bacterium]|nr:SUMF1/EgtB/PvdO family nonheme iron enzyme [Deltaproteobacteria bacterium]